MPSAKPTKAYSLLLREREIPLTVKKIRRSRRLTIQWRPLKGDALLTLPYYVSIQEALRFAESRKNWLERRMAEQGEPQKLVPGMRLNVLGKTYELWHDISSRGVVREDGDALIVSGDAAFFARRLQDWLKARAKIEIETRARAHAVALGKSIKRVGVRDTVSRWGSCSTSGSLSFSWRLIFAPMQVLDYVVAHEVAHLVEMNHSPRFWRVVEKLAPHHRAARDWLNQHGHMLYTYC